MRQRGEEKEGEAWGAEARGRGREVRGEKRLICLMLVHSPNAQMSQNSWDWAKLKLDLKPSLPCGHRDSRTWAIIY